MRGLSVNEFHALRARTGQLVQEIRLLSNLSILLALCPMIAPEKTIVRLGNEEY